MLIVFAVGALLLITNGAPARSVHAQSVRASAGHAETGTVRAQLPQPPQPPQLPLVVCLTDDATGESLTGAQLKRQSAADSTRVLAAMTAAPCTPVLVWPQDTLTVRRIGYRPLRVEITTVTTDTLHLALANHAVLMRAVVRTVSPTENDAARAVRPAHAVVTAREARALGGASASALVSLLPYQTARSARGELSVSLRGARREQVAVTLDGVPLNDPSTGVADVSDLPLALLGGAALLLGSDPLGTGSGATGGTLALRTGQGSEMAVRIGAFGERTLEGVAEAMGSSVRVRSGGALSMARNDYRFTNSSTTSGAAVAERRVNNDVDRVSLFSQLSGATWHLLALGSRQRQGMVGAVNVRDYDEDRATSQRLLLRAGVQRDATAWHAGVRLFGLEYRDARRPALNSDADVASVDVQAQQLLHETPGVRLRATGGVAADMLRTSANIRQDRWRGFGMTSIDARLTDAWHIAAGGRLDAVQNHGFTPSFSADVRRSLRVGAVSARIAQSMRVPTLYDLYFASPQRLAVRALDPERVRLDAELGVQAVLWHRGSPEGSARTAPYRVEVDGALSWRDVRDAIVWFPGNFGWSPANVGAERLRGAEARAAWRAPSWTLSSWATWYDSELRTGALRIPTPYVPRTASGAQLEWRQGPWHASTLWRRMDRRPYTVGPRDRRYELPAVSLLDAALGATIAHTRVVTAVTLSINNAANTAWQSVRGFPSPGRAVAISIVFTPPSP